MTDCSSIQGSTSSSSDVMTLTTAASSWCAIPTNSRIRVLRLVRPHHTRRMLMVTGPESNPSYGFAVRGGKEFGTGFFVSQIERNSEADLKGLRVGDQILRLNNFRVEDAVHKEFIRFVGSQDRITLKVRGVGMLPMKDKENERLSWNVVKMHSISNTPSESSYRTVTTDGCGTLSSAVDVSELRSKDISVILDVAPRTKLGLGICKGPEWKPGIFVQFTKDKSVAREAGLRPGDQILSVNSIDFSDVLFSEAVAVMKSSNKLEMIVRTAAGCDLFPGESSGYNSSASSVTGDQSPCWADVKQKRLTAVSEEPTAITACWNEALYAEQQRRNGRTATATATGLKEVNKTIIKLSENGTSINNTYVANPHLSSRQLGGIVGHHKQENSALKKVALTTTTTTAPPPPLASSTAGLYSNIEQQPGRANQQQKIEANTRGNANANAIIVDGQRAVSEQQQKSSSMAATLQRKIIPPSTLSSTTSCSTKSGPPKAPPPVLYSNLGNFSSSSSNGNSNSSNTIQSTMRNNIFGDVGAAAGSTLSSAITEELKKRKEKQRCANNINNEHNNNNNDNNYCRNVVLEQQQHHHHQQQKEQKMTPSNGLAAITMQRQLQRQQYQHQQQQQQQQQQHHPQHSHSQQQHQYLQQQQPQPTQSTTTTSSSPTLASPAKRSPSVRAVNSNVANCNDRNNTLDQHSALMDEFKRAHQRMFKNGFHERESKERQEALKRTTIMDDDSSHRTTTRPLTNGKSSANDVTDSHQQQQQQQQQQLSANQTLIPPPPPQFANSPPKSQTNDIYNYQTIKRANGNIKINETSTKAPQQKPPSEPTPDYDNIQQKTNDDDDDVDGRRIKINGLKSLPKQNGMRTNLNAPQPPSPTKRTIRLGAVTIGEYEQQRKEPNKFEFIQNGHHQNGGSSSSFQHELQNTLSRSKLKNGNQHTTIEHKRDCPLRNGFGATENSKQKHYTTTTTTTEGTATVKRNGNGNVYSTGILKNGNSRSGSGSGGNTNGINGQTTKVIEKTISFGN